MDGETRTEKRKGSNKMIMGFFLLILFARVTKE
jgi:hypothetical protein